MTEVWYFGSDWCTACHVKRPLVQQACKEYGIKCTYRDVDEPHHKEAAELLGLKSIPAVVVLKDAPAAGQEIIYRAVGGLINEPALVRAFGRANGEG